MIENLRAIIDHLGIVSGFRNIQTSTTLNTPTGHTAGSGMVAHAEDFFQFEASNNITASDLRLDNNSEVTDSLFKKIGYETGRQTSHGIGS